MKHHILTITLLAASGKLIGRKTIWFFATIIWSMFLATISFSEGNQEIEENNIFIIPIDHPKILTPSEFVMLGMPIRTLAPIFYTDEFRMAFSKRPNILSCLSSNQPDENFIDLSLFLWQELSSPEEAKVCLFYVADILGEPEKMLRWFTAQGFGVTVYTGTSASGRNNPDDIRLHALDKLQRGEKVGFWPARLHILSRTLFGVPEWRLFNYNNGASVSYRDGNEIFDVRLNQSG